MDREEPGNNCLVAQLGAVTKIKHVVTYGFTLFALDKMWMRK
jgi:hypothetical protein